MTVTEDEAPLPAIFGHACTVYKEMESEAELTTEENPQLIWEGHLTKLVARLHLSVPYYTSVTRELKRMGCIKQLRRGGGNASSQWLLVTEPTEELFRDLSTQTGNLTKRRLTRLDILENRLNSIVKEHNKMREDYALIIEILQEKESVSA
jgi:hypothetical protein